MAVRDGLHPLARESRVVAATAAIMAMVGVCPSLAQPAKEAYFGRQVTVNHVASPGARLTAVDLTITVSTPSALTSAPTDPIAAFQAERPELADHLKNWGSYEFVSDWPSVAGIMPLSTDNPPFTPGVEHAPQVTHLQWISTSNRSDWRMDVSLHGVIPKRARGEIHVRPLAGWSYFYFGNPPQAVAGAAVVRYSRDNSGHLQPFRGQFSLGWGTGGPSLDFSGEGVIQQPDGSAPGITAPRSHFTTLSIDGKLPLDVPGDVADVAGAKRDASGKVPDTFSLALNRYGYRKGGKLEVFGLRARTTSEFRGAEVVAYFAPVMGWFDKSHGFYASEIEAGWRTGDTEFSSLRTIAQDRGHWVARLGTVLEWAPRLGGINRDLSRGLRFYVRGRGWLDSFKDAQGDPTARIRYFADSELFYNFNDQWRIFARAEYGYVLPDLNKPVSRPIFAGVGAAF